MEVEALPQLQSAVRLPTPEPEDPVNPYSNKRKRPSYSRSPSPRRRPALVASDVANGNPSLQKARPDGETDERFRQLTERFRVQQEKKNAKPLTDEEKQQKAREEYQRLLNVRSGGTYIPPARLRALQAQVTDKTTKEYQRMAWEALKKAITGLVNKANIGNLKHIVPELFGENLIRGRGLFCRSIMKAQAASLPFTPIYAAMAAIVNTKLPQVGELLIHRLVVQFRKAYKRNDKAVCLASTSFLAHLCNQQVVNELLAAYILQLLLSKPTDDSVEIAIGLTREVGQHLEEMSQQIALLVFDQFRNILHEADIDKRTQYMIEVLFQVRKDRYKDNPAVKEELDLIEEEDQITHQAPTLDDAIDVQDGLNVFRYDPEYEENEAAYAQLKAEILGEAEGSEDDDDNAESEDGSDDEGAKHERELEIKDQSNTDLTNLRRTIYLTINSSADFEECCHKLMKINLPVGRESELPSMIIETCSQRPTYEKFYGLVAERFARLNRLWTQQFEEQFVKYYDTIHRYETNRLRNIAKLFGHVLSSGAIGWHVLSVVHLNEEETTSSSRIFIKILFQDLVEAMGMKKLQETLSDQVLQPSFQGIFPTDHPRNTRFSINYFTSIGMGAVTEGMREFLKNMPKPALPALPPPGPVKHESRSESVSSYSSYSSVTGSSRSYSRSISRTPPRKPTDRRMDHSRTSPRRVPARSPVATKYKSLSAPRGRARSRSLSPPPSRRERAIRQRSTSRTLSRSPSYTPPPRRQENDRRRRDQSTSRSMSASPPPRERRRRPPSDSVSRSPPRQARGRYPPPSASMPPRQRAPAGRSARRNTSSPSLSPSRSRSRSRSPYRAPGGSGTGAYRRSSPPPRRRSPPERRPVRAERYSNGSDNAPAARRRSPDVPKPRENLSKRDRSLSPYSRRVALTSRVPR